MAPGDEVVGSTGQADFADYVASPFRIYALELDLDPDDGVPLLSLISITGTTGTLLNLKSASESGIIAFDAIGPVCGVVPIGEYTISACELVGIDCFLFRVGVLLSFP